GGDVPSWLLQFSNKLDQFKDTLADYGLEMPSINKVLGGFDVTIESGIRGYFDPEHRECQKDFLGVATGELGTVIDGECWDAPPGGPFNTEEKGTWVDKTCWSAYPVKGTVIDGD